MPAEHFTPSLSDLVTVEAPAGRVPSVVILPSGRDVKPDARGRITIAVEAANSLIHTAGWRRVSPAEG